MEARRSTRARVLSFSAFKQFKRRPDRQKEAERTRSERLESVMPVECRGGIIVGVRQNGEDGGVRARNAGNSVEQKRGSKTAAAKLAVDGQPAEECRGNDTVGLPEVTAPLLTTIRRATRNVPRPRTPCYIPPD